VRRRPSRSIDLVSFARETPRVAIAEDDLTVRSEWRLITAPQPGQALAPHHDPALAGVYRPLRRQCGTQVSPPDRSSFGLGADPIGPMFRHRAKKVCHRRVTV
jgi:hypothetical protein